MAGLPEDYTLRAARNEDGPAITALIYEILREYGLPPDPENTDQGLDRVEEYFDLFEVIEAPGQGIIATLGLISRDPSRRRLQRLLKMRGATRREAGKLPCKPDRASAHMRRPAGGATRREAKEDKICELVKMFVHPSQRGKGLGQFLLDRAIEQAKLMGFTVMELETASVLKEAIGLYRKAGFTETDSGPHAKRCDITMVRSL